MEAWTGERIQDERSEKDWVLKRGLKAKIECAQEVQKTLFGRVIKVEKKLDQRCSVVDPT